MISEGQRDSGVGSKGRGDGRAEGSKIGRVVKWFVRNLNDRGGECNGAGPPGSKEATSVARGGCGGGGGCRFSKATVQIHYTKDDAWGANAVKGALRMKCTELYGASMKCNRGHNGGERTNMTYVHGDTWDFTGNRPHQPSTTTTTTTMKMSKLGSN